MALTRCIILACLVVFVLLLQGNVHADTNIASAGWAEVEITPPLGIALGGRGGNYTLASHVIDPLHAQVLYLKDGKGTGFVLVSMDLIGLPHSLSDQLRQSLVHELGVNWNLVLLNFSHTHSGPNMLRELMAGVGPAPEVEVHYFEFLREKVLSAARVAKKNLVPVSKVEIFEGHSHVAINRRGRNKQGNISILPNPRGPIDDKLWIMRISPVGNRPEALVFSYACHPVIVYGYAFAAISADFPGIARKIIREKNAKIGHVQFVQGLAGNVRPRAVADLEQMTFRGASPEKLTQAGTDLANDVLAALTNKCDVLKLDFAGASDRPFMARGNPPSREVYEKMKADEKNPNTRSVGEFWLKRYDSGEGFAKGEAWPVGLVRLDQNHFIAYLAGEPVVEWRGKITDWLAPRKIVTFGYSQEASTYLPTEELLAEGGYEVLESNRARMSSPAPFASGIHESMRQSFLRQLAFIEAPVE
ncbi:MAG: hypothetical protein H0X66_08925 [Verrucomicrobia bacterium]|nr:hypothetical protein [Verrucomicrobiota bacterium]